MMFIYFLCKIFFVKCFNKINYFPYLPTLIFFVIGTTCIFCFGPGRVAQWVGHLTRKSGVLGSIPGLATYFRFSFRFFKKGSCQLLAKVCARSTGLRLRRSKPAQEKCG